MRVQEAGPMAAGAGEDAAASHGDVPSAPMPLALEIPPLAVRALVVTKADLIAALRLYVPHLTDVELISGDRFLLAVGAEHPAAEAAEGSRRCRPAHASATRLPAM